MDGLKTLLHGLASEARPYDVVDRAEQAVRRRRRLTRLAPVAAGVAVVLVLGAGWALLREPGPEPVVRPGPPATWLPPKLSVVEDPTPLPTDRGIGPAALLYIPFQDGPPQDGPPQEVQPAVWRIVTPDGRQYGFAAATEAEANFPFPAHLSPDGRWLVVSNTRGLVLRDLTGTSERVVSDRPPDDVFWSRDSRQLVLLQSGRGLPDGKIDTEVMVVDVLSGARSPASSLGPTTDRSPLGVDDAGNLVLKSDIPVAGSPTSKLTLWFVDPVTGRERRQLVVDPRTLLGSSASAKQGDQGIVLGACLVAGDSLLVLTTDLITGDRGLLGIDLDSGRLVEQHALPGDEAGREPVTASPETILFFRTGSSGGRPEATITALEQLDRNTGELSVATSITGEMHFVSVRGMS